MAYTKQNSRVTGFYARTEFDAGGAPSAVRCDAHLVARFVNDQNAADVVGLPPAVAQFDLLDPSISGTNITAATKTVTYAQLAALLRQACLDRANAAGIG